jgi:hypothetical protein
MKFFLTDGHSLRSFGSFDTQNMALNALDVLKQFTAHEYDLLALDDDNWSAYDKTQGWMPTEYETILGSIGLPTPTNDIDGHPRYKAALNHIQELEQMLDNAQEAIARGARAFERKLSEMMDAFSSDELFEAATDDVDLDYQPFDPATEE